MLANHCTIPMQVNAATVTATSSTTAEETCIHEKSLQQKRLAFLTNTCQYAQIKLTPLKVAKQLCNMNNIGVHTYPQLPGRFQEIHQCSVFDVSRALLNTLTSTLAQSSHLSSSLPA